MHATGPRRLKGLCSRCFVDRTAGLRVVILMWLLF